VPTGISQSHRNRPAELAAAERPTQSQLIGQAMSDKAVNSGKVSAAEVAHMVFDAIEANRFYIYSHPQALGNVSQRMEALVAARNPPDPFAERPDVGAKLRERNTSPRMSRSVGARLPRWMTAALWLMPLPAGRSSTWSNSANRSGPKACAPRKPGWSGS
jgi:hypothetical protein